MRLLSQADPDPLPQPEPGAGSPLLGREEAAFPPSEEEYRAFHRNESGDSATVAQNLTPSITVQDMSRESSDPKIFYSFPNSPYHNAAKLPGPVSTSTLSVAASSSDGENEDDDVLEFPARRHFTQPTVSVWQSRRRRVGRKVGAFFRKFNNFMTAPLWAALLSLVVACIPPFQHALEMHIQPVKGALAQAGNCSIPLTLVVLGAYFYSPPDPEQDRARAALPTSQSRRGRSVSTNWSQLSLVDNVREMFKMKKRSPSEDSRVKEKSRPGETKTVIIAVCSRMIVTPLLLLPMMALSTRFNLQEVFDECVVLVHTLSQCQN